jgi:hypothetical protein
MTDDRDNKQIWKSLSSAIDVEMREATTIRGISGQDHPVQAIAVDDKTKRVVIFSAEPSPRIAALMQIDVQATLPDAHVLVARPVIFDLSEIARRVAKTADIHLLTALLKQMAGKRNKRSKQSSDELMNRQIGPAIRPLFATATKVHLPFAVQVMDIFEQIANVDWASSFLQAPTVESFLSTLLSMTTIDSAEADRRLGVCPIPLYDFSDADYELLLSGKNIDELRARLKSLGIYQYFFPAPDQLLLGLADKGVTKDGSLVSAAEEAPVHGHPLGAPEIFQNDANLLETLEELKGAGYVADAEFGVEITEKGRAVRKKIKIRPRESLINKISKILSIKVDLSLKDLFK